MALHCVSVAGLEATSDSTGVDVAIVGGSFAGCLAAIALSGAGRRVMLIESCATIPDLFRAEKIHDDQLLLLSELGLLDDFKARASRAKEYINIRGRHIIDRPRVEEYCLLYPTMIEVLRARLPAEVEFKLGRVLDIITSECMQRVVLGNGEAIPARLVVLSTGPGEALLRKLGLRRVVAHRLKTVCVGFTVRPPASGFRFPGLTAYGERQGDGVDYLAIFPLGDSMRGNLFMFTDIRDQRIGELKKRGLPALFELLPGLRRWLHDCGWVGDVVSFQLELAKCENVVQNGVVVIGDAYRTSCPAVGTGLSCALVDVVCLRDLVPNWLATPGMGAEKIAAFYDAPRKKDRDFSTHALALKRRYAAMDASELRRTAYYLARGVRDRLHRLAS